MIDQKDFYSADDVPGEARKQALWAIIQPTLSFRTARGRQFHAPSFAWGVAAAILFVLAGIGTYSSLAFIWEDSRPRPIQVERAYQSAIREFENIALSTASAANSVPDARAVRVEQLRQLDLALQRLRDETNGKDLSPLLQSRLRSLYSLKLQILQQMVEQGDLEL